MRTDDILQLVSAAMQKNGVSANQIKKVLSDVNQEIEAQKIAAMQAVQNKRSKGGRPRMTEQQIQRAAELLRDNKGLSMRDIGNKVGVNKRTIYRHLNPDGTRKNA